MSTTYRLPRHTTPLAYEITLAATPKKAAFSGSLAAALARGEALEDAISWANAAAALSVTGHGAIGGMPTLQQVRQLLWR